MQRAEAARRRGNPVRAGVKAILHALIKVIVVLWRLWRRYPLPALIVLVMLLGSAFALASGAAPPPWRAVGAAAPPTAARAAIETYLKGQREYDAALMWEAMGDEMKAQLRQAGATFEAFQEQVQQVRESGVRFGDARNAGGAPLDAGHSVHLYVVTVTDGRQSRALPFLFRLNQANKIVSVD
jgi:hypothetical protein